MTLKSYNPANGDLVWEGKADLEKEIKDKIQKGLKALASWRFKPIFERIEFLKQYAKTLEMNKDELTLAISKETGKPLWESKTEVAAMIGKIPIAIQAFQERCQKKESSLGDYELITDFRPHGLISVFGPFNFPGHLPNGHIVPALLAGNTVLLRCL